MKRMQWNLAALLVLAGGCALHDQVQYFEVVDPDTRNVNFYRMTLSGHGGGGVQYSLQAGYFSSASVDVLRGQIPSIPEADLPAAQDKAYDSLVNQYYQSLADAGARQASQTGGGAGDADVLAQARLVWLGTLSPADVAAMGMHGSTNPFTFRKLVFWATANNIDLRQFSTEIDSMIGGATSLVRAHKADGQDRYARQAALRRFLGEVVKGSPTFKPYAGAIEALIDPRPEEAKSNGDSQRK